jgi:DNA polymerase epsilon subunit 1
MYLCRPFILEYQKKATIMDFVDVNEAKKRGNVDGNSDPLNFLSDMREYDVPYAMRAAIDLDFRVGAWHIVTPDPATATSTITIQKEMLELCEPKILAFDIECEKSPLKFPNAERDRIFMISYMTPGQGYLLINREVVSEDVENFEYTPMSKYPGPFTVINLKDEEAVLRKFIEHIQVHTYISNK